MSGVDIRAILKAMGLATQAVVFAFRMGRIRRFGAIGRAISFLSALKRPIGVAFDGFVFRFIAIFVLTDLLKNIKLGCCSFHEFHLLDRDKRVQFGAASFVKGNEQGFWIFIVSRAAFNFDGEFLPFFEPGEYCFPWRQR